MEPNTNAQDSDETWKRQLKSNLFLLTENLKCDRIADYLWRDDVLTDDEYDIIRDVTTSGVERVRELVIILQRLTSSVALKPLINALRCTGQFYIADRLTSALKDEDPVSSTGDESLTGYVHDMSSTVRLISGANCMFFKLQTGPSTFTPCVTECPYLHRPILMEYVSLRAPLLIRNVDVVGALEPEVAGKRRCGDRTWFSAAAVVDFPWSAPELELTKLGEMQGLPFGLKVNVRANVVGQLPKMTGTSHSGGVNNLWPVQRTYVKLQLADETEEMTLSMREDLTNDIESGKAYEFCDLLMRFYGKHRFLLMTEHTKVKEIPALPKRKKKKRKRQKAVIEVAAEVEKSTGIASGGSMDECKELCESAATG